METDDIKRLADIIAQHHLNDIERLLRVTSISLRNTTNKDAIKALKNQQDLLSTANEFLKNHTITDANWRQSFACFAQLTDWFASASHIRNHRELSLLSWFLQLDSIISSKIPPKDIIVLGTAYLGEPNKFAAFLYWLLENNVLPHEIESSRILHRYFAYHICEISVLHQTYALLSNRSEKTNIFLEHVRTMPSQMRGFVNQVQEDSELRSYNVMGELFAHNLNFEVLSERSVEKLGLHINFQDMHSQLFDLFGWEFINVLNLEQHLHRVILKKLILSPSRQKIIEDLPRYILSGQFLPEVGYMMLYTIGSVMPIISTSNNGNTLLDLIKSEPFYIHSVRKFNLDSLGFSQEALRNVIQTLCTDVKYQNMHHLPYLVKLAKNLTKDLCFLLGEYSSAEHAMVIKAIFDLLLQCGSALLEEDFKLIIPIIAELVPLTRDKMGEYSANINAAIDAFNHHLIDYEAVVQLWSSQLSHVNLFKRIYPSLCDVHVYPFIIYQLHAKILQGNYLTCAQENRPFELNRLLETISADPSGRLRIMQEVLLSDFISESVMKAILTLAADLNIVEQCVMQPFGDERSVFYHAYTRDDAILRDMLRQKISIKDEHFIRIINIGLEKQDLVGLGQLWILVPFTEFIRHKMIESLLNQLQNDALDLDVFESYIYQLRLLLVNATTNELPKQLVVSTFRLGVKYLEFALLRVACSVVGPNALLASEIKRAIKQVAARGQWGVLALLCGLETGTTFNPSLIKQGNVLLYLRMVEHYRQNADNEDVASPFDYTNSNEESLLHIAANHCSFQIFQKCFVYLKKNLSNDDIKQLLEMTTVFGATLKCYKVSCDQKKINDYIELQRHHYCHDDHSQNTDSASTFTLQMFHALRRQRKENDSSDEDLESVASTESSLSTDYARSG